MLPNHAQIHEYSWITIKSIAMGIDSIQHSLFKSDHLVSAIKCIRSLWATNKGFYLYFFALNLSFADFLAIFDHYFKRCKLHLSALLNHFSFIFYLLWFCNESPNPSQYQAPIKWECPKSSKAPNLNLRSSKCVSWHFERL